MCYLVTSRHGNNDTIHSLNTSSYGHFRLAFKRSLNRQIYFTVSNRFRDRMFDEDITNLLFKDTHNTLRRTVNLRKQREIGSDQAP